MNHTDQTAAKLYEDVCAHPQDDTPRLILADRLEDTGDPHWAELIRLQCELARRFGEVEAGGPEDGEEWHEGWEAEPDRAIHRRCRELFRSHIGPRIPRLTLGEGPDGVIWYVGHYQGWRRGFPWAVAITGPFWIQWADPLRKLAPIGWVSLTSRLPYFVTPTGKGEIGHLAVIGNRSHFVSKLFPPGTLPETLEGILAAIWPGIRFHFDPPAPGDPAPAPGYEPLHPPLAFAEGLGPRGISGEQTRLINRWRLLEHIVGRDLGPVHFPLAREWERYWEAHQRGLIDREQLLFATQQLLDAHTYTVTEGPSEPLRSVLDRARQDPKDGA
jgi:uncharacterized protein (TIGR02996 family)